MANAAGRASRPADDTGCPTVLTQPGWGMKGRTRAASPRRYRLDLAVGVRPGLRRRRCLTPTYGQAARSVGRLMVPRLADRANLPW